MAEGGAKDPSSSAAAGAGRPGDGAPAGAPGGLFGYFIDRRHRHRREAEHVRAAAGVTGGNVGAADSEGSGGEKSGRGSRRTPLYHEWANAGGSFYFGSMGALVDDSDSDDDAPRMAAAARGAALGGTSSDANAAVSKSWLAKFQRGAKDADSMPASAEASNAAAESSSSWMSQAWKTVDSAKEWVLASSPVNIPSSNTRQPTKNSGDGSGDQSSWRIPSSVSNAVSNTVSNTITTISSLNPFSDDTSQPNNQSDALSLPSSNSNSNSAFLPKFASKFEWATKQRNPYQAVIGRDADYLLSSRGAFYYGWKWFSWGLPSWLPWIANIQRDNNKLVEGEGGTGAFTAEDGRRREMIRLSNGRRKSQPSEASVQAVRNLLLVVQHQVASDQEENGGRILASDHSDSFGNNLDPIPSPVPISPPHSPKRAAPSSPMLPSLSTPNPQQQSASMPNTMTPSITPFPDLKEDNTTSFDSEPSYDPSIRSSPVRASPGVSSSPIGKSAKTVPFSPVSLRPARTSHVGTSGSSSGDLNNEDAPNALSASASANNQAMHAEMAARLAEGTLRAYRDLALDEATELHSALHHWTIRWERPFLGWLEAGPDVWFSENGYTPQLAGKKVSQIQAVLARRCAVIGELQQHLWRANWQKGVAEWGMLGGGVGGEWTSVVGEFGGMDAPSSAAGVAASSSSKSQKKLPKQKLMKIFNHSSFVGTNVSNSPGGSIVVDQGALTTWSIDAMRVIRDQLYRALPTNQGVRELPFVEHWPREERHFRGEVGDGDVTTSDLPLWAQEISPNSAKLSEASRAAAEAVKSGAGGDNSSSVVIADLSKMSNEVGSLLQSIEIHLEQQRVRRLNRLRPPSRLRRNWYMVAFGVPVGAYVLYKLTKEHGGFFLLKTCITKIADIYRDHVSEPINSIYQELFTKSGRLDVTDRKARIDAIDSLKRMLQSWYDEYFPDMPLDEKMKRAETMDISLIEEKMEESIKHIYELNSVVRMSLIEMQFIKKELLSALVAMDELMGSNEINMRIAAMTPAVILLMTIRRAFRLLFYAFFQVGKSKEEIYSSFRQTMLDIERLLTMRDNPPSPPESLEWGSSRTVSARSFNNQKDQSSQTLSAEDLGMLLLHIHECRNILWQSRRRFRSDVLRNVSEDLAELAGERGPVSVSQQLQIISRMSRTYPFMKVVSSGIPFEMILPGAS